MAKMRGKKPGRPAKPEGERLEQFSIRLPGRLKFGLEQMARLQGRSLSQSMEWALQTAMNTVIVARDGHEEVTVLGAIDVAWQLSGWERVHKLYEFNPAFVAFEDRHACKLVELSEEYKELHNWVGDESERAKLWARWSALIDGVWSKLTADLTGLRIESKVRSGWFLLEAVGLLDSGYVRADPQYGHPLQHALDQAETAAKGNEPVAQRR